MQIIDTRGLLCPAPLILTKRALKNTPEGDSFTIITDNDTARQNLLNFISEMGFKPTYKVQGDEYHIFFATNGEVTEIPEVQAFCQASTTGNHIVAIKSEVMGQGNDELGRMLMRSCVNTLSEIDQLPQAVILYNGGVLLAKKGCDTADSLEKLALKGVKIIACGACVDFFDIKQDLIEVTQISNMYKINTMLAAATNVIYP